MTISEIIQLRKDGRLDEALEAAQAEYERNANKLTAGTLFWCYYDLIKQQTGDDAEATFCRMEELANRYGDDDQVMRNKMEKIRLRFDPVAQELLSAVNQAKNGVNVTEIVNRYENLYIEGKLNKNLNEDFGWLLYYTLKHTNTRDDRRWKELLTWYLALTVERPSLLHSLILTEAIRFENDNETSFRIRDFFRLWNAENLRTEDWKEFRNAGYTMPSTVLKLIAAYSNELINDNVAATDDFCSLVDEALRHYPDNNDLPLYKARVLISQGHIDEAVEIYKNLIQRAPSKFYLWSQLADIVHDTDIKLSLLCKALFTGSDEQYLGNVRLTLAKVLIDRQLYCEAKYELANYNAFYTSHNWRLSNDFHALYRQVQHVESAPDNNTLYQQYISQAEDFIYSSLPMQIALKISESVQDDKHRPNRKIALWTLRTESVARLRLKKPDKYGLNTHTPNGTFFNIRVLNGKIVWIKPCNSGPQLSWIKRAEGIVRLRIDRKGNQYTFINNIYVPRQLLEGIADGQQIKILAVKNDKNEWKAISLR